MDQAPIQELDVPRAIENTLVMLHAQTEHAEIVREYQPGLPLITAYGSELNQVWTALLENALEATNFRGKNLHQGKNLRRNDARGVLGRWAGHTGRPQSPHLRTILYHQGTGQRPGPRARLRDTDCALASRFPLRRVEARRHLLPGAPADRSRPGLLGTAPSLRLSHKPKVAGLLRLHATIIVALSAGQVHTLSNTP